MADVFKVLHKGLNQEIIIKKLLLIENQNLENTNFLILIYGRILVLDGIIQITEKDEAAYSEMLVHPAMQILDNPKEILIIGGGDGAVAEEILKYKFIKNIDLVDIDEEVINLSKNILRKLIKTL